MTREEYESKMQSVKSLNGSVVFMSQYIKALESTIEAQEIIIKDKSAYMEAMSHPKTCDGCVYSLDHTRYKTLVCSKSVSNYMDLDAVDYSFGCIYYGPKAQP